jgi:hypothetical protein
MDTKLVLGLFLVMALMLYGCATQPVQPTGGTGTTVVSTCTDTDNGKNALVKGSVESASGTGTDSCLGDGTKVMEYYCSGGIIKTEDIACIGNTLCSDGACKETACFDTDNGQDNTVIGTVSYRGSEYTDSCNSDGKVIEYYCDASGMQQATLSCAQGYHCASGKCIMTDTCVDSDGGQDLHKGGTVTMGSSSLEDYCGGNAVVVEYYCSDGAVKSTNLQCPSGESCVDGICTPPEKECRDTDGGKYPYDLGTVTYWSGGQQYTESDSCYGDDQAWENWCEEDATVGFGIMDCDAGDICTNGRCISNQ